MKALVYQEPLTVELMDMPEPVAADGDVVVQVEACGVCGSDMHAYQGHDERRPAPLILGHEAAGVVITGSLAGKRVTVNPLVSCGTCLACQRGRDNICHNRQIISMPPRQGAFAEYIAIPERNLVEIPDWLDFSTAALVEPLACGWHAASIASRQSDLAFADCKAVVFGGGAIGIGAALSLRAMGIGDIVLVEPNQSRAEAFSDRDGIQMETNADSLESEFDVAVDGVGIEPTRHQMTRLLRPGGVGVHIGLGSAEGGFDMRRMTLQELCMIGTYTYTMQDFRDAAQAMFDQRLGALDWHQSMPLEDGPLRLAAINRGQIVVPKTVLMPTL